MIDLNLIKQNPEIFKKTCQQKRITNFDIEQTLALDQERRILIQQIENIKQQKNAASKKIPTLNGDEKQKVLAEMQTIGKNQKELEDKLAQIEKTMNYQLLRCPNPCSDKTPEGKDDKENKELYKWGELPKFNFAIKDHVQLGKDLDIIDMERGVKIAGSRFYFLKGDGARLEMAIFLYTLDKLVKKGFTPFIVPLLVGYEAMMGTSYFPGGEEQAYALGVDRKTDGHIESDGKYLIGTSEVSVTSYHRDEILEEGDLPKLYCGYSPCFRREAGTYGKDTHGLYRIHQFQKVEQVIICKNDDEESEKMHQMILKNAEEVLQDLKLPYHVVAVCTGDMGQGQFYKNDIETWMPSRNSYGETHSCSTFHEFQARRLNLKYRDKDGKVKFCHTLNNTCIASPRILIPILEIYQNQDGSVTIPEVLRSYMGKKEKIEKKL
ncbi:MAG: seryl-tRNA synthetase, seryl-tRNA synthetase [Candidatus Peregrinibacteria bacterium GW2011_GWF2_33_10]|nr:MAG: seryl-tRNA synthetase, seryl-tRNA synthetase [Candidatus Peregrinibacteria bacterium GW2011_GWF2_33_10]